MCASLVASRAAIQRAADNTVDWLIKQGRKNILVDVCNECDLCRIANICSQERKDLHYLNWPYGGYYKVEGGRLPELLAPAEPYREGAVRSSNGPMLAHQAITAGGEVTTNVVVPDESVPAGLKDYVYRSPQAGTAMLVLD